MKNTPELLVRQVALAEEVVVLEILNEADAVLFDHTLDFVEQFFVFLDTSEIGVLLLVSRFHASCRLVDDVLKAVTVFEELCIFNFTVFSAINECNLGNLIDTKSQAKMSKDLSKYLLAHFEVAVVVKVLKEALGVKSMLADYTLECLDALLDCLTVLCSCLGLRVDSFCTHVV